MSRPHNKRSAGFPAMITELRLEAGLTIVELAAEVGISSSVLSYWERGHTSPNLRTLERLMNFYGYEWDWMKK
jgi:transcriptional regulator with XRE-family HTH domain